MPTSGEFRPVPSNGTYFKWNRTGFSSSGNYSDINVEFGWGFHGSPLDRQLNAGYLSVNGTVLYNNGGLVKSYEANFVDRDHVVYTGSIRIYHNADGTKTFSATAGMTGYSGVRVEGSPSFTLDTIPLFPGAPTGLNATGHVDSDPTTATLSWTAPADVGAGLNNYQLQVSTSSAFGSTIVDATNGSWGTSRNVTLLPKGTTLYARVRAATVAGWGPWSGTLTFTTGTTIPGIPQNLVISNVAATSVDLAWDAPSDNGGTAITGYQVQRALNSGFSSGAVTTTLPASPRSLQITGLSHSTTYYVRVRAVNAAGNSTYTATQNFTTGSSVPTAPTIGAVSSITKSGATVAWTAPGDTGGSAITGYDVQYSTDPAFSTGGIVTSASSPKAIVGLIPSTTYYARVRAVNANGAGPYSGSVSFKTTSGVKVGNGSTWVDVDVYRGNGTEWVLLQGVWLGDGSAWV